MTHPSLTAVFAAARVTRWHTHPRLSLTHDPLDGHQGRVARIIMALHPAPSAQLLMAALTHDDGEHVTGDMPGHFKAQMANGYAIDAEVMAHLADAEDNARSELWGNVHINVTGDNADWLRLADRIDAFMWCGFHAAEEMDKPEWQRARQWIFDASAKLGCNAPVGEMLREVG